MLTVLMPLAGRSRFLEEDEYQVPPPLIEIQGIPMIEWAIRSLDGIARPKRYHFVVSTEDCKKYSLDSVLRRLTDDTTSILRLDAPTEGALCSALMAIDAIDNDDPLLIANGDQVFDVDLLEVLRDFEARELDFGALCFESVHPRWSFVRLGESERIVEVAEKRPISKNAIAGFYYFRKGSQFVQAAMSAIERGVQIDGAYFTSQAINEMVLEGKNCQLAMLESGMYHSFYNTQRIRDFERQYAERLRTHAQRWVQSYRRHDLDGLASQLADGFQLRDHLGVSLDSKEAALEAFAASFASDSKGEFRARPVICDGNSTVIEYERSGADGVTSGVDVMAWNGDQMVSMRRYVGAAARIEAEARS